DGQSDGTLVSAKGIDRTFTVRDAKGGQRQQAWHYPSRAECMVCHSRAANFVLGLCTLQLNKDHAYGTVTDNQLRTLEHLGVLRHHGAAESKQLPGEEATARAHREARVAQPPPPRLQRESGPSTLWTRPPEKYGRLVDPYDGKADLAGRARSYLHANCSQCHV